MNINWEVRFKNPVFWVQIATSIVLPILAYLGLKWEDMTTWGKLAEVFLSAVQNPVILVSIVVSVWNTINDPTTKGISDSSRALTYDKPFSDKGE